MTWPHLLSLSRVVTGPAVAALALARPGNAYLIAAVIFALASLTDLIDGKLARYSQQVSPLGVFLDTTSDKVMVGLTLVGLTVAGLTALWVPLVILGREFLISGLRSYAATCDQIISAHIWGKGKAALTMVAITCVLVAAGGKDHDVLTPVGGLDFWNAIFTVSSWLLYAAAVLTIISGARYVVDAWPLFRSEPVVRTLPVEPTRRVAAGGDKSR